MSTLFIRLPSHAVAQGLQPGMPLYCEFALSGAGRNVEREGVAALPDMGEMVSRAQRVVLLLAASDVTLLRVQVPPLSPARLRAALPNMVEDQLMSDPAECVVVADNTRNTTRTVAVMQRSWLEVLSRTLLGLGARSVTALPAQLCLPAAPGAVSAAVAEHGLDVDVAVRLAEHEGIGLSVVADQQESAAFEVLQSLAAVVREGPLDLYVPPPRLRDYEESLHIAPGLNERITVHADSWQRWIAAAGDAPLEMMAGLGAAAGPRLDWKRWRWPLALAAALLLVNVIALNIDWLRMRREADALSAGMIQTYRAAFPKDPVVIDPLAQLRQKLSASQRGTGQLAPDDFLALSAAFGEAWNGAGNNPGVLAGLEYRDRVLNVRLKPGSEVQIEPLQSALASRNLSISRSGDNLLQVRSGK
ncbi:MAG TPA: type II secretion system protein GspL [Noviherbaspirillum sp.]|uniref:type II secretion system protein GspL n=1 Tax=Noviherbaspirillum sp. TaxID=1926288 RepID=UPI002F93485A